ncbi:MAG: hypothetical protein ACRD17_03600, partial [Terriglobales bacterium]
FGGSIGGPLIKNKTFIDAVYEGVRQAWGQSVATRTMPMACFVDGSGVLQPMIPSAITNTNSYGTCVAGGPATINVDPAILPLADVFPQPNVTGYSTLNYSFPFVQPGNENYEQVRLDQTFSPSDTAFVRATVDRAHLINNHAYAAWIDHYTSEAYYLTGSESHIFSPVILNTAQYSFSRTALNATSGTVPLATGAVLVPGEPAGSISPGSGVSSFSGNSTPGILGQDIFSFSDDLFWSKCSGPGFLDSSDIVNQAAAAAAA